MQCASPRHGRVYTMPYMTQQVCTTYTTNTPTTRLVNELRPLHMAPPPAGRARRPLGPLRLAPPARRPRQTPAAAHTRAAARRRRRRVTNAPPAAGRRAPRMLQPPTCRRGIRRPARRFRVLRHAPEAGAPRGPLGSVVSPPRAHARTRRARAAAVTSSVGAVLPACPARPGAVSSRCRGGARRGGRQAPPRSGGVPREARARERGGPQPWPDPQVG